MFTLQVCDLVRNAIDNLKFHLLSWGDIFWVADEWLLVVFNIYTQPTEGICHLNNVFQRHIFSRLLDECKDQSPPPCGFSCLVSPRPRRHNDLISSLTCSAVLRVLLVIALQGTIGPGYKRIFFEICGIWRLVCWRTPPGVYPDRYFLCCIR